MFENIFFYLFICLLFFGIGDILGVLTKAKVSAVFVSLFLFLIGFMSGLIPTDIIKLAGLTEIGKWGTVFLVFSMGTSINIMNVRITKCAPNTHRNFRSLLATYTLLRASSWRSKIIKCDCKKRF